MSDDMKISGRCPKCDKCYGSCRCNNLTIQDLKSFQSDAADLMSRMAKGNPGGHHDWLSRDHAHIDCHATGCKFNVAKSCSVPSLCKIKPDGGCAGFEAKPLPPVKDGD